MGNKMKDVIEQEFKSFINEEYNMNHKNFEFREQVNNSTFYNYDAFSTDYDVVIEKSNIVVNWRIGFVLNETGVNGFNVEITSVEGNYLMEMYDKQSDEKKQETPKDINQVQIPWKFKVGEVNLTKGGALYITKLNFHFNTGECDVSF